MAGARRCAYLRRFACPVTACVASGGGILLEPIATDLDEWFRELDHFADIPFMEDGRQQPPMPEPEALFD